MKVLISGSTGLIGSALYQSMKKDGWEVLPITRENLANPSSIPMDQWEGVDIVIHLAGESVAKGLWSENKKKKIYSSRVDGTKNLVAALLKLKTLPKAFFCASAMGYYGDGKKLEEQAPPGKSFLSQVCVDWEAACTPLKEKGSIRVIHLRFAHVLGKQGGSLQALAHLTKWGLGSILGSGSQLMSWVGLNDVVKAIFWLIEHDSFSGPFNFASPHSVTQKEFIKTIGKILHRPVFFRLPAALLRFFLKDMADELFLCSLEIIPKALLDAGYEFEEIELEKALRLELDA